jgi:hypothetical protein
MDNPAKPLWSMLVISLPGRSATPRMRIWRALKGLGAVVLRDGVYLLPHSESAARHLQEQAEAVMASGGDAHVLTFTSTEQQQAEHFRKLFDRTADYARLIEAIRKDKSGLTKKRAESVSRHLKKIRREFEAVAATDHFAGPAKEQVQLLLSQTEVAVIALLSPGEPRPATREIRRLNKRDYQRRVWATRARPWVDRLASAWLIRRFIDPKARFVWLKDPKDCPADALGFDFDNATFTHVGARVTFEVLITSFGLEENAALTRMGALVHYLDVGGVPVAEAAGLEMILNGAHKQYVDDDKLFKEASKSFDFLYASFTEE